MQEETTQKTIALVFRASSFTARHFEAVLREAKRDMERHDTKVQNQRNMNRQLKAAGKAKNATVKHGKMKVSDLIGQGQGASTIQIPDDIRMFQRIAQRHNVDFAIKKDKTVEPPKYTVFFKARDNDVITDCFKDYLSRQEKARNHQPFKKVIENFRERAEQINRSLKKVINRGEQSL